MLVSHLDGEGVQIIIIKVCYIPDCLNSDIKVTKSVNVQELALFFPVGDNYDTTLKLSNEDGTDFAHITICDGIGTHIQHIVTVKHVVKNCLTTAKAVLCQSQNYSSIS